jgi:IS5 family transposase
MKITTRCGEDAVSALNNTLVATAAQAKVLRLHKVRADTTVIEANVAYPVDSSLLAKGIPRLTKLARRPQGKGFATGTKLTDRTRKGHRLARTVVNTLRRRGELARDELRRLNAELAGLAAKTVGEVEAVAANTRRKLASLEDPAPADRATLERLELLARRVAQVATQTHQRVRVVEGVTPEGATRLASLHDPDARPIRKGRLGRPVEFG